MVCTAASVFTEAVVYGMHPSRAVAKGGQGVRTNHLFSVIGGGGGGGLSVLSIVDQCQRVHI